MASMIKSGIFVRHLTGLARNLVFNSHRNTDVNLIKFGRLSCSAFTQAFASAVQRPDLNLDESIRKLDQDVRRIGRISRRDVEEVFDEIRRIKTASSSQSLMLIRCCGNVVPEELPAVRTALVQEIWKTLNNLNVSMDITHYNALLRVYLENEHPFSPTEFLADLEAKGIDPNRVTYQRLISRYCQEGDMDGATKILEFMREKQLPINENVFSSLIMGHSEAGDIEAAIGILPVMREAGIKPTADTYTSLLCAYAKHGKTDEILSTLDECESNEIYLADKDLFEVIYHLAKNGHTDFADNIIPRLQKSSGYNQHAASLILRLVNIRQEDTALKILKTMPRGTKPSGELYEIGSFFIRQLVKSGRPTEKILSICGELQQTGLHHRAISIAVEMGARSGNLDVAVPLFKELKQNELPLRQHYFWPLICAGGKVGTNAILDVLRVMQSEFNMTPNGETIRDYVLPNMQERDYEKIILTLRTSGISSSTAILGCVHHAITHHRLKAAANLMLSHPIYYQPGVLRRPLVEALIKTDDFQSYQRIVRSVYENMPRLQKIQNTTVEDEQVNDKQMQSEVVGQFVLDAAVHFGEKRAVAVEKILSALVEQGLSMSKSYSESVQKRLGSLLTPEISTLLEKLTAGELEPVPYESRSRSTKFDFSDMPVYNLERMIQQKEAQGENVNGLQRALLQALYKANDVQKYEELFENLSKTDFILTSRLYAQRIDLHCNNNGLDKALAILAEIKSKEPDFVLDDFKTIKLVQAFVALDRVDESIEFLNSSKLVEKSMEERPLQYNHMCWNVLNILAEKGRDADVTKVFNALEENNFIEVSNVLLGPLIRVHLVNNDLTKALEAFEMISTKYKCTPLKNELSCKLIQMEDAVKLQLVTDLGTNVHGEVNCLYDLVLSFVECGRIRQARKILETPGLANRSNRISDACKRFQREGKTAVLEDLVQTTKGLNNVDHHEIFYQLLLSYCKEDSTEKALNLWLQIQEEEDFAASDQFLTTLANFLRQKGVKVPFVEPSFETPAVKKSNRKPNLPPKADPIKTKPKDVGHLTDAQLRVRKETAEIEVMVQQDKLDDATQHVMKMLEANTYPLNRTLRFYLNKMAQAGRYEVLEKLLPLLPLDVRRNTSFNNRLGNAYVAAGKSELFLDQIIQNFNNGTTVEELKELETSFPRGTMCGLLQNHPELHSKFEKFAQNVAERGFYAPLNILWMNSIETGNLEQADRLMKTYLADQPKLMFNNTLKTARDRKDETIVLNMLKSLANSKISETALGAVHSCLIDVYCLQQKYDEALNAVNNTIKDVCLENVNRSSLLKVKEGLEAAGKKFPHQIPDKKKKNAADSSSSSSSDDEPVKK
ncbi:leucine-rich PPR motif-containing protein, mitochondrial isoform X2 [Bradysia coprophila]|uniref:leucine-rich PPR motif-containing protein, mitochondrial isoform X2 n=1 Tax=Bradysia coprophila TaxID=38358 RepID=UPI00187D7CF0|nr:leucine-rich PPR motif-containing protein, mitochondrial isoform X2 [Bradysia coprophila]